MTQTEPQTRNDGMPYAIAAYLIWGLLPLYLRQVHDVPRLNLSAGEPCSRFPPALWRLSCCVRAARFAWR
jgi:EamA domain-containing membrane protein RarD